MSVALLCATGSRRAAALEKLAAYSRPAPGDGPITYVYPRLALLPAPQIAGLLPARTGRFIEYASPQMNDLALVDFRRLNIAFTRLIDQAMNRVQGRIAKGDWAQAINSVFYEVERMAVTRQQTRRANRASPFDDPAIADHFRLSNNAQVADMLKVLLKDFLDIDANPTGGIYRNGDMVYRLEQWCRGLIIDQRVPRSKTWLTTKGQHIVTREQAQAALTELDLECRYRCGLLADKPETSIVERDNPGAESAQETIARLNAEVVERANAAARSVMRSANPPVPSVKSLVAGSQGA
jgi:hypothetical protein